MPTRVFFNEQKKSHTHTDLLWNWFKRLRFSTTYVWINSLLFFCIWKTDKSFFFRHIWWRLWKYHWVLSVASFPVSSQYSSLSSIIYVLDIFRNVAFVFILTSKYWCYVFIWCQIFCHFSYFFSSEFRRPKIILSIWHVRIFLNKVYLLMVTWSESDYFPQFSKVFPSNYYDILLLIVRQTIEAENFYYAGGRSGEYLFDSIYPF